MSIDCLRRRLLLLAMGLAPTLISPAARGHRSLNVSRLVVGFPPGGASDLLARALAPSLRVEGTPSLVENKPGAAGQLAVLETKRASADGLTVLFSADPIFTIYPHVYKDLGYDPLIDFVPVAPVASEPMGLIVGPLVPAEIKTLPGFIVWCAQNPAQAFYATAGAGTTMHFLGTQLASAAQFSYTHVPHRGAAAGVLDVVGAQIASTIVTLSAALPLLSTGKLRVLAVSGQSKRLPDVPTFSQLGYAGLDTLAYYGTYVRAGTPDAAVQRISDSTQTALQTPEMLKTIDSMGVDPFFLLPGDFAARVKSDLIRWKPIVAQSGFHIEP